MDTVFTHGPPEDRLALLDALYEQAPVGLSFVDTELRYRRVNATLAAINGLPIEAHIGRTVVEVLGELGEELAVTMRQVLESGERATGMAMTGETAAAPGETRSWRVSLYPVADSAGSVRGVGSVVVETTEERRATVEAEAAQALLDAVFDTAPVGLALWDPDLRYVRINEAGARMNDLPEEAHLGRRVEEVLSGPLGERIVAMLREVLRTGEPVLGLELSGERPGTGELQHREASYFPLPGPGGAVAGVGAVIQDVSARRRLDELRRRLLDREHEARLAAEAARGRAELTAAAGRALAGSLDWEETVNTAVQVAVPAMADLCALHLRDAAGEARCAAVAQADPAKDALTREDEQAVVAAMRSARTRADFAARSRIVVPVRAAARLLGALTLIVNDSGRSYGEEDVLLAEALADRAALALENARLHTERTHIARTLQRSLLPPELPAVPCVECAASYDASAEAAEVGGDFYDLFESEPGVWTVLIGDVAGKGAEAASLTSLARYTLRTASMLDASPVDNLRLLNDALLVREAGTCTVLYARLWPGAGRATMVASAAGHPPPLVLRADGALEELTPPGTLLGAVEAPRLQSREVGLAAGDLVLFYTDGATDVRAGEGVLGDGVLRGVLAASAGCSAQEVVERVAAAVREAQGGHLGDDLALLALRVRDA